MSFFMRSTLKKLPVVNIRDIDVESSVSGSLIPKSVRFVLAHPDKYYIGTFQSLTEIDAYCSNKILTAKRKDFYGGNPKGIRELIGISIDWILNTGCHAITYESWNEPYLVLKSYDNIIECPRELVLRTGESTWQVYSFYAEGIPNIK